MRTKKILSIVLTAMLVIGVFGIGASAYTAIEPQAAAAAQVGWPTPVTLVNRTDLAARWDQAVIEWTGFANAAAAGQTNNGYVAQRAAGTASVTWSVRVVDPAPGFAPIRTPSTSEATAPANAGLRIWTAATTAGEQLVIRQGRTREISQLEITMTVTANATGDLPADAAIAAGTQTIRTQVITIELFDQTSFQRLIDRAEEILANDNRYQDDFLEDLQTVVNGARTFLVADMTIPANRTAQAQVQDLLEEMVNSAPNYFRVWFINSRLLGTIVWGTVDFFNTIAEAIDPAIRLFTAFFGIFSIFLPFLTILLGIFI